MLSKLFHFGHNYPEVNVTELSELLAKSPKDAAFIDVRRGDEWNTGYIEGFEHIPLNEIPLHAEQLATYPRVYFLCRSGGRSKMACDIMNKLDYKEAYSVSGGLLAWGKKGYPLVRQTTKPE